jgi:hypothetical protein
MQTIVVPGTVIPRLREGAYLQLAHAAEAIKAACEYYEKDDPPLAARRASDETWALFDRLGWTGAVPEKVELDVREHRAALSSAIESMNASLTEIIADHAVDDATKAERTEEHAALRDFDGALHGRIGRSRTPRAGALAVPPVVLARVREGAYDCLVSAAEDIERSASSHVPPEPDARMTFDRAWSFLEAIGWSETQDAMVELSIAEHGAALLAAVEDVSPLLEVWLSEREDELRLLRQFHVQVSRAVAGTSL